MSYEDDPREQPARPGGPETDQQQFLRSEFENMTAWNYSQVIDFYPAGIIPKVDMKLATPFPEIEEAEAALTLTLKTTMLQRMSIYNDLSAKADKAALFDQRYKNGVVIRILPLTREDGTQVYVKLKGKVIKPRLVDFESVTILSNEHAPEVVAQDQEHVRQATTTSEPAKVEVKKAECQPVGPSLEELFIQDGLAEIRRLTRPETAADSLDLSAMIEQRQQLVRAMLPVIDLRPKHRKSALSRLASGYSRQLDLVAYAYEPNQPLVTEAIAQESDARRRLLQEQLAKRRRFGRIGAAGLVGLEGVTIGLAGETFAAILQGMNGQSLQFDTGFNIAVTGMFVIGGMAHGTMELWRPLANRLRQIRGFNLHSVESGVLKQLEDERQQASTYLEQTNPTAPN